MTLPAVANIMAVLLLFMLMFGILGVQLFMGRFASCNDPTRLTKEDCTPGTFVDAEGAEVYRLWLNPDLGNFDNVGAVSIAVGTHPPCPLSPRAPRLDLTSVRTRPW